MFGSGQIRSIGLLGGSPPVTSVGATELSRRLRPALEGMLDSAEDMAEENTRKTGDDGSPTCAEKGSCMRRLSTMLTWAALTLAFAVPVCAQTPRACRDAEGNLVITNQSGLTGLNCPEVQEKERPKSSLNLSSDCERFLDGTFDYRHLDGITLSYEDQKRYIDLISRKCQRELGH